MNSKLTRIAITGAYGRMGSSLIQVIQKYTDVILTYALVKKKTLDIFTKQQKKIPISTNIEKIIKSFDILIDFSTPKNTLKNLKICHKYDKKIIIGTTGFTENEYNTIKSYSKKISIVMSSNFSIGINLIFKLLEQTSKIINDSYDIEIVESHHRNKLDSPSGTALQIGNIIAKNKKWDLNTVSIYRKKEITNTRERKKIGFSIIRGGDVIGEHKIIFLGTGEKITISHQANNRDTFASGAIQAAIWIKEQAAGLFSMIDVLKI
ncbi:4-hydroxy-tetrahydrodipicolinate reductase [Buchnera aphidicola]|uniref:4-hydroxy-tetrahydrodipicolinate reductase n=1 Tax=Buchnera aphidicola (Sarucallis kahawaluokalani) TaxID=1241878 RepID=A0A4D6YIT6_9GAMM|nr:4-hydroxy-tetrahydrodipicolinate reductase [Buchnera aphidicola]QCI25904.1 4-hydroxy-tetrahydrodipicolinate reductase [Buchnera aphidicola (Sarucallis kahawaluokalani)]